MLGDRKLPSIILATFFLLLSSQLVLAESFLDALFGTVSTDDGNRQNVTISRKYKPGQVIVSFGDRKLYFVNKRGHALSYPIAIPNRHSNWTGQLTVTAKKKNPEWVPTQNMRRENPDLPSYVPGGHPKNPLGKRALYLGDTLYRIHGTDAPWTIGKAISKGCIRMFNEDVIDLYAKVPVGTEVIVTWKRFHS